MMIGTMDAELVPQARVVFSGSLYEHSLTVRYTVD
jgi:hypothetical protein